MLDRALFRRFDDVLHYELPDAEERLRLMENVLGMYRGDELVLMDAIEVAEGLSHAELDKACRDAMKTAILSNRRTVDADNLIACLFERHLAYGETEQ